MMFNNDGILWFQVINEKEMCSQIYFFYKLAKYFEKVDEKIIHVYLHA